MTWWHDGTTVLHCTCAQQTTNFLFTFQMPNSGLSMTICSLVLMSSGLAQPLPRYLHTTYHIPHSPYNRWKDINHTHQLDTVEGVNKQYTTQYTTNIGQKSYFTQYMLHITHIQVQGWFIQQYTYTHALCAVFTSHTVIQGEHVWWAYNRHIQGTNVLTIHRMARWAVSLGCLTRPWRLCPAG